MKNGPYTLIVAPKEYPGKKYRDRYCYEHMFVWWKHFGKVPDKGFEIHHKNTNHRDNRISNLELLTSQQHRKIHTEMMRKDPIKFNCGYCGKKCYIKPNNYRWKIKNNKYGKIFCSQYCGAKNHYSEIAGRS